VLYKKNHKTTNPFKYCRWLHWITTFTVKG